MFNHCPRLSVVSSISYLRHSWEWESFSSQPPVDWAAILAHSSTVAVFSTFMRPSAGAPAGCFVPKRCLHPPAANAHLLHSWSSAAPKEKVCYGKLLIYNFYRTKEPTASLKSSVAFMNFSQNFTCLSHRSWQNLILNNTNSTFIVC